MMAAMLLRAFVSAVVLVALTVLAGCQPTPPPTTPPPPQAATPEHDLVIRNGRVVDGTGAASFVGDIAVRDGRIAAVGTIARGPARSEIDASGLVVAPGFIDVHTHVDGDIHRLPQAENFVRDGVTTIVTGNCGYSVDDVKGYFNRIRKDGAAVNVATLIGHNTVLRLVKGDKAGELSPQQMEQAKAVVERAMLDGAVGMSTGLIYTPGTYSSADEIIELQRVAARQGGIYATHMRSEAAGILPAIDEAIRIGREANSRVQVSHFKLPADVARTLGGANVTLQRVVDARASGLEVWLDQYPYTASSTSISTLLPDAFLEQGQNEAREQLKDPAVYERVLAQMREQQEVRRKRTHMAWVVVASCRAFPEYDGRNVREIAQIRKHRAGGATPELLVDAGAPLPPVTMEDQLRTVLDLFMSGGASCVFHTMNETEVETIMRSPLVAVASDSGIRDFRVGVPHPRGYGTNARVLGRYARDRKLLTLEEAVRKMTSLPALSFRFHDRGVITAGNAADLTLFDPETVMDKATFEEPHQYAEGIVHVIVNGTFVLRDGQMTGRLPGGPVYSANHAWSKQ
jgi:N-acyl-D-amino-acid deacylase